MNINRLRRRMAAATGLVAVTLFIGACGSEETVDNAGIVASPASTAPAAGGGTAGKTDSKAESCRKAEKAKADFAKVMVGLSDTEGISAYGKGLAKLGTELKTIADTASDPAVATALQGVAETAAAVAATDSPLTADQSAFGEAGGKLELACVA